MIHIGKRSISEFFQQLLTLNIITILFRFFSVHESPIKAIFNELFSIGKYPATIKIKNKLKIKLYSFADFSTLNLVFCREDYYKPNKITFVIDIGSNIGISCLYWFIDNPKCSIEAYEPSTNNFKRLVKNLKKYKKNIILKKIGVSNKAKSGKLYLSKSGVNDSTQIINGAKIEKIKLIDINSILKRALLKHDKIDILKIDVEGHEVSILKSIKKKYFNKIKVINVEGVNYNNIIPKHYSFSFKGSASRFVNKNI
jgi:FkbM family methyltransferase